jgi:hypothetical protein
LAAQKAVGFVEHVEKTVVKDITEVAQTTPVVQITPVIEVQTAPTSN